MWYREILFNRRDITIPSRGMAIEITRYYNSMDNTPGMFGKGWKQIMNMPEEKGRQ